MSLIDAGYRNPGISVRLFKTNTKVKTELIQQHPEAQEDFILSEVLLGSRVVSGVNHPIKRRKENDKEREGRKAS